MQTILGPNGTIGRLLARALISYTAEIRLASRNPRQLNGHSCELMKVDLLNSADALKAIEGSEVVYLTVGLPYDTAIWQSDWPVIIQNVIQACEEHRAKLVFFDNVYLYGKVDGWMLEDSPVNPSSMKGEVRARVAQSIHDAINRGSINALIARSADFYGETPLSIPYLTIFERFLSGKTAQSLVSDAHLHSYTYVCDAAKATALLGNTDSAYNQVWHLPTDKTVLTGREFIELAAKVFQVSGRYTKVTPLMMKFLGWFSKPLKEMQEMNYQLDSDYLFSSNKFDTTFGKQWVSYEHGLTEIASRMKKASTTMA
ncbi:MAG: NAD-dependent epimerase/dehydratase family protein [Bacteroidota bacterium]